MILPRQSMVPLIAILSVIVSACDGTQTAAMAPDNQSLRTIDRVSGSPLAAMASPDNECIIHNIQRADSNNSHDADYAPANVIDGSLNQESRWSSNGNNRAIVLDLGQDQTINTLFTAWYNGNQRDSYFNVHTSTNGSNWTSVLTNAVAGGTNNYIKFGLTETSGRYLRITGNGNSDSSWTSITEVAIGRCDGDQYNPPAPPPVPQVCNSLNNLTIEDARSDQSHDDNYSPAMAIDNNLDSESRWSSLGAGKSVVLDLGEVSTVRRISTAWYKGDVRQAFFDVETSMNGSTWRTVLSDGVVSGTTGMVVFNVTDSLARYVKIIGQGNSASEWNSLLEVEVLGCGNVDSDRPTQPTNIPTPTPPPGNPPSNPSQSISLIKEYFDLEGGSNDISPYRSNDTMVFDALAAKHVTPNGNGWRHELKVAIPERRAMDATTEAFSARVKAELSDGAKTIVAQYHASGTGTIVKVYVSDTNESGHADSRASNGIFDLYVRVRKQGSSSETIMDFGTIRSGQSFDLNIINQRGLVTVEINGSGDTMRVADSDAAYLKFGNYLQAQDPESGDDIDDKDDWANFYRNEGINKSVITFSNVYYTRS